MQRSLVLMKAFSVKDPCSPQKDTQEPMRGNEETFVLFFRQKVNIMYTVIHVDFESYATALIP